MNTEIWRSECPTALLVAPATLANPRGETSRRDGDRHRATGLLRHAPKKDRNSCDSIGVLFPAACGQIYVCHPGKPPMLKNMLAVLAQAGGGHEHICRMTAYCIDKPAYLAARADLGRVWKRLMGRHYPAMSKIFTVNLLDHPAKIELEATAVIPEAAASG